MLPAFTSPLATASIVIVPADESDTGTVIVSVEYWVLKAVEFVAEPILVPPEVTLTVMSPAAKAWVPLFCTNTSTLRLPQATVSH